MSIFKILTDIEKIDGEVFERLEHVSRRSMFSTFSKKLAAVAVPTVVASMLNKAYGATPSAIAVLNFALTLEYLEDEFYKKGVSTSGLIPATDQAIFAQISKHETQHVNFLKTALGANAVAKPNFDFTAKGAFADVFSNYKTFAIVSHALEDTGVRAYKGQAGNLMATEDKPLLEYALQIHSIEARHAAVVRQLLNARGFVPGTKSWITLAQGSPAAVYAGDDNLIQGGVNLAGLAGLTGKSNAAISEAFDEPLTKEAVLAIAGPFIA